MRRRGPHEGRTLSAEAIEALDKLRRYAAELDRRAAEAGGVRAQQFASEAETLRARAADLDLEGDGERRVASIRARRAIRQYEAGLSGG